MIQLIDRTKLLIDFIKRLYKRTQQVYIEGGSALYFVHNISRDVPEDADFTIREVKVKSEFEQILATIVEAQSSDLKKKLIVKKDLSQYQVRTVSNELYHIDLSVVPERLCHYDSKKIKLEGEVIDIACHSIYDIFIEKLCGICDKDRVKLNDVNDIIAMIDRFREVYNRKLAEDLYQRKSKAKRMKINTIAMAANGIDKLQNDFEKKYQVDLEKHFTKISTFLSQRHLRG